MKRGSTVVGVRGQDCIVLGVERKAVALLQDPRSIKKIAKLDDHITMAFAGFTADARVLISKVCIQNKIICIILFVSILIWLFTILKARVEAQSFRLTCEDAPTIEYMARFIAKTQQKYTQRGGVRPFGVSAMMAGFAADGSPQLYLTDPAGTFSSWRV